MYHPHADEMTQMAMGMMGFWVTHPKNPDFMKVDRDFVFLLNNYDIDPGSYTPRINTMLDFNLFTFNSRVFPGIDPLVVRQGDRVRIRCGNLTMTNHPIHLHGHEFVVTGTDGGWTPPAARWPEVTTDVAVGQMRAIEFDATEAGDWAFHCHKSHHTMNAMGHAVPTMIGVDQRGIAAKSASLVPDYMVMGERGMADMGEMEMPLPDNTLPMMSGQGPFGGVEMGGMFTVLKVRKEQKPRRLSGPRLVPASGRKRWPTSGGATARRGAQQHRRRPVDAGRRPAGNLEISGAQATRAMAATINRLLPTHFNRRNYMKNQSISCHRLIASWRPRWPSRRRRTGAWRRAAAKGRYRTIAAEQHAFGREGDPKQVTRTIAVDMNDSMRFRPSADSGQARRNHPIRREERGQGHARNGARHAGGTESAWRADAEKPGNGTRRTVHGACRTGRPGSRWSGSSHSPANFTTAASRPATSKPA